LQANPPTWREVSASAAQLAEMLGIDAADIGAQPLWVNTGAEQLIIPLQSVDAVLRCRPSAELLQRYGKINQDRFLAYVWSERHDGDIEARFFFAKGTAYAEDPATGSACANLGGWFIATGARLPVSKRIYQGAAVARPSRLQLRVTETRNIFVSGTVIELGRGTIDL
jgi:PhzF family phenazine biosynthesis protein